MPDYTQWQDLSGVYNEINDEVDDYQQLLSYAGTSLYKPWSGGLIEAGTSHGQLATHILYDVRFTGKFRKAVVLLRKSQRDFRTLWATAKHKPNRALFDAAVALLGEAEAIMPPLGQ